MDKDNEIELIETIQEKDRKIKELEAMNENIGRELLARTDELNEVLEKQKNSVPKDKIREKLERLENQKENYKEQPLIYMLLKNQYKELLEEE